MKSVYILTHMSAVEWEGTYSTMLAVYTELPTAEVLTEDLRVALTELDMPSDTSFEGIALELLTSPHCYWSFDNSPMSSETVELRKTPTNTVLNV